MGSGVLSLLSSLLQNPSMSQVSQENLEIGAQIQFLIAELAKAGSYGRFPFQLILGPFLGFGLSGSFLVLVRIYSSTYFSHRERF